MARRYNAIEKLERILKSHQANALQCTYDGKFRIFLHGPAKLFKADSIQELVDQIWDGKKPRRKPG